MSRNILWGYNIYSESISQLTKLVNYKIEYDEKLSILSLNTLKMYIGEKEPALKNLFKEFDCIIPDGQSIAWASSLINGISLKYISGVELMTKLIDEANIEGYSIFFLGSPEPLLEKVKYKIKNEFPGIKRHEYQHGYYDIKNEYQIVEKIISFNPDILFVAFGSPRKEEFIKKYYDKLNSRIMMGVGGSYEVFTGEKKLGEFTKKIGLRWFMRMIQDPKRLFLRYTACNSFFIFLVLKTILKKIVNF